MNISLRFPTAYTILFVLIALVALGTWFVPAGQYDRVENPEFDREVPVPGTYETVEQDPQGIVDLFVAPIAGFYDPDDGGARAIDVALFVLIIGGFLGIVARTGALQVGIGRLMAAMSGHERWSIPILMAVFAAGGTTYGMAEETLAFYAFLIPIMLVAGYDSVVAAGVILLGAGIGRRRHSLHRRHRTEVRPAVRWMASMLPVRHALCGADQEGPFPFHRRRPTR